MNYETNQVTQRGIMGGQTAAIKVPKVPAAFDEFEMILTSLHQLTTDLRARINPVLSQEPNPPNEKEPMEDIGGTVYDRLNNLRRKAQKTIDLVQDIHRLLEL